MIQLDGAPIVQIGDLHVGSAAAICPPDVWLSELDAPYSLNSGQRWLYERWLSFWRAVDTIAGRNYSVILVGDLTEGVHHGGSQLISRSVFDHAEAASQLLAPVVRHHVTYAVGGTIAHAGESYANENTVVAVAQARALRSVPGIAWFSWGRYVVQAAHHIGTVRSPVSQLTALSSLIAKAFGATGRWGQHIPDLILRGHRHQAAHASVPRSGGRSTAVCVSGSWQLPTTYSEKLETIEPSQIGGWVHIQDRLGIRSVPILWTPWDATPRPSGGGGSSRSLAACRTETKARRLRRSRRPRGSARSRCVACSGQRRKTARSASGGAKG